MAFHYLAFFIDCICFDVRLFGSFLGELDLISSRGVGKKEGEGQAKSANSPDLPFFPHYFSHFVHADAQKSRY